MSDDTTETSKGTDSTAGAGEVAGGSGAQMEGLLTELTAAIKDLAKDPDDEQSSTREGRKRSRRGEGRGDNSDSVVDGIMERIETLVANSDPSVTPEWFPDELDALVEKLESRLKGTGSGNGESGSGSGESASGTPVETAPPSKGHGFFNRKLWGNR